MNNESPLQLINQFRVRNKIYLDEIEIYINENKTKFEDLDSIFDLTEADDITVFYSIAKIFADSDEEYKEFIKYFNEEIKDKTFFPDIKEPSREDILFVISAFICNQIFFVMAKNWITLVRSEVVIQHESSTKLLEHQNNEENTIIKYEVLEDGTIKILSFNLLYPEKITVDRNKVSISTEVKAAKPGFAAFREKIILEDIGEITFLGNDKTYQLIAKLSLNKEIIKTKFCLQIIIENKKDNYEYWLEIKNNESNTDFIIISDPISLDYTSGIIIKRIIWTPEVN